MEQGLSTRELADQLGVSRQSVWYWETGQRSPRGTALAKLEEMGLFRTREFSSLLIRAKEQLAAELGIDPDAILIMVRGR